MQENFQLRLSFRALTEFHTARKELFTGRTRGAKRNRRNRYDEPDTQSKKTRGLN